MHAHNSKWIAAALVAGALVAGCGGGGGGSAEVAPDISNSVSALLDYINNLIASVGENGELVDVNSLTLVADDTSEPVAF